MRYIVEIDGMRRTGANTRWPQALFKMHGGKQIKVYRQNGEYVMTATKQGCAIITDEKQAKKWEGPKNGI